MEIDAFNYLSLFKLKREKIDIREAFFHHWLYHGSKSPIWFNRIQDYDGMIEEEIKKVDFEEEKLQLFYDQYGYEPDE
jgi:hypothetical protein